MSQITPPAAPSFRERLAYWAARQPNAVFIVEAETDKQLTYGAACLTVAHLRRRLGPARQTVVLNAAPGILNALTWLAALGGGHTLIPLAPQAPEDERQQVMARFHPDVVVTESAMTASPFLEQGARLMLPRDLEIHDEDDGLCDHGEDGMRPGLAGEVLLQTSGTTGQPKWVRLTAPMLAWAATQISRQHRLTVRDRGLSVLPFFHVNAPVVSLGATLQVGASLVIARNFSRRQFWPWIATYGITWASVVPTIMTLLLDGPAPPDGAPPKALRFVRSAAAPLPALDLLAFEARFGVSVVETYGLTEAGSQVCANPVAPGRRTPGAVGRPTGVDLRIRAAAPDAQGCWKDVAPGNEGEIWVRGPGVIQSYLDDVDHTAFVDGWFRTGDLGRFDERGNVIIVGRLKDCIKRGGETIAPRYVEEVLRACQGVRDVALIAQPDRLYGEVPVAFVEPANAWSPDLEDHLWHYARAHLATAAVPVRFLPMIALPRTAAGKVQRGQLRSLVAMAAGGR